MTRPRSVARKLIDRHLQSGSPEPGEPISIGVEQTLTQDATGTTVMLELEAMQIDRVRTQISAQYVDHNLVQTDHRNRDDHEFLRTSCARYGIWFSPPGNGVSHPLHQQHFGKPGTTLLGADSHTVAAGAMGMLAIGSGGIEVAMAMAGEPFHFEMPEVWGVELTGALPEWVSAKDVILEMLRRHGVRGGLGRIIEYYGPGLKCLSAMDRHVIANMGAELGATTTVFPADDEIQRYLEFYGRGDDFEPLAADEGVRYDVCDSIDLSTLVPLIAKPTSPGNVVPVEELEGQPIGQAYIGSSANPGFRDFAVAAAIVDGRQVEPGVSFDINPTTRRLLADLSRTGDLTRLVEAGARIHQAGCNGCIGMGQAPATDRISLRTTPRNFPGRSGTREDAVHLVSPETAAASALTGRITDPRSLAQRLTYPRPAPPRRSVSSSGLEAPPEGNAAVEVRKGPDIVSLPSFEALPQRLEVQVLLRMDDDVSTDEIMPAGTRVLPWRSNVPKLGDFAFEVVSPEYAQQARARRDEGGEHAVVAGENYGQGSSREHAALVPRSLGLRLVLARGFARIHRANLVSYGVLPLQIGAGVEIETGDQLAIDGVEQQLRSGSTVEVENVTRGASFEAQHDLSPRELEVMLSGGTIPWVAQRSASTSASAPQSP